VLTILAYYYILTGFVMVSPTAFMCIPFAIIRLLIANKVVDIYDVSLHSAQSKLDEENMVTEAKRLKRL